MEPLLTGEGGDTKPQKDVTISETCKQPESIALQTSNGGMCNDITTVEISCTDRRQELIYKITDTPPLFFLILFAIQQCLLSIVNPLSKAIIVSEVVCATKDDSIKAQLLSATLLMTGVATFLMTTVGVRLPIFQGPASSYMVPLISMMSLEEWKCPEAFEGNARYVDLGLM
ncbi:hypothetical protein Btru_076636 [Bulinus truncatus]|nr:hypothetical protein Btru_076636 [Bulinus truncatus]